MPSPVRQAVARKSGLGWKSFAQGTFILIDCNILCIFYWIKDILCSLVALSKTTLIFRR